MFSWMEDLSNPVICFICTIGFKYIDDMNRMLHPILKQKTSKKRINYYCFVNSPQLSYIRQFLGRHKLLHRIVLQEMKKRLYLPNVLPPLKTVAKGYEYYSTTSTNGMVYLRKKLDEGRDAREVELIKK